ncbi:uncharacterized protein PV06_05747 [Exophiala oligosperma]|uniref:Major facilitator superfamily (MFS) profile domain-containing protein n=1 Tax=Exophiala oligosperma TaxID=215243 RepID=A0A0D2E316_9EURO|nr:uncharacterized protein PV06_05747 [Exophiala oligosperma]KIW42174.1 hypothetical protein PV06_05747 [Exophiala oligosperma]
MSSEKRSDDPIVEVVARSSVFTTVEKWGIVAMVSYAAWFSTLSSFIYYPALHTKSETLSVSVKKVNRAVTSYLAVATIAQTLAGDAADQQTPVCSLDCPLLSTIFDSLLTLPQGTFSIAHGVLTDVASPAERGTFASAVSFAITCAPSIGPIFGGVLTYAAGWARIFWFLAMASGSCLLLMLVFLPETARNIVCNGFIRPLKYL